MAKPTSPTPPAPERRSERELLAAYRAGDREAANVLVERSYKAVYASLFRLTGGDPELAADLTQETYRRAWKALPRFQGKSRLGTWLYRIAYTTFLNHVRKPHRIADSDEAAMEVADTRPGPETRTSQIVLGRRLRAHVLGLPETLRFAVTARFWGDRPVREIATSEGITTVAVRKRLKKALGLLAVSLEKDTTS